MNRRKQNRTLLIVGEGYCEVAFLKHLKRFENIRNNGTSISIRNAKGRGAEHVINYAIRCATHGGFDLAAAWFDTDTDWTTELQTRAEKNRITLITSDPCFEAVLLRGLMQRPNYPKSLKEQLAPFVKNKSTEPDSFTFHFSPKSLDQMRKIEPTIENLMALFSIPEMESKKS